MIDGRQTHLRAWLWAGLTGGALAGAADAVLTVLRGVGGLGVVKALRLLLLDASLLGFLGLLGGALIGVVAAGLARRPRPLALGRAELPELAAAVLVAPLALFDARAMFAGRKAASLSGHGFLSVALALLAVVAIFALTRAYRQRLALAAAPGSSQRRARFAWLALMLAAAALHAANVTVLVRLYPWFHGTLALGTVLLVILAARLRIAFATTHGNAAAGPVAGSNRLFFPLLWAVLFGFIGSLARLPNSQILRFAVYERTTLAAQVMRRLPMSFGPQVGGARPPPRDDSPDLPDGPHRPGADVLVITIDALRADHLGAYGYQRGITPHIDALAARSTRFAHAYAQAPHTSFSVASMLTGKYFATLARLAPAQIHTPLPSVMRMYGWRTAAFYPPAVFYIDAEKLKPYAANNFGFEYVKFEYLDAQRRVDQITTYYETVKPAKALVWVHFFEPHEPYQVHPGFELGTGEIDRYDSEIAYVDAAVGRLLDWVRAHRPNTIVILSADHGEEFDEHGGRYHGTSLYEEQMHIPLLVFVPGVAPAVINNPVQLLDVTPTVLSALNIPVPVRMRGTDLGPWLARPPADEQALPPAFAEVDDHRLVALRDERLICDMHGGFCAYYDLGRDPGQRRNLADDRPDRAAALRGLLDGWLDEQVHLEPLSTPPAESDGDRQPRAVERGRLGDAQVAGDLAALMISAAPADQRREAARLLAALPVRPELGTSLSTAAADSDPQIAVWAQVSRAKLGDPQAVAVARGLLSDAGAEQMLRLRAALALTGAGDRAALTLLGQALDPCPDIQLCREIIAVLGRLKDRRAVPFLLAALPQVQNRREMVVALGEIADPSTRAALIDRLESDQYVPVRIEAARALAKLGDRSLIPTLERAAAQETEAVVADAARAAAAELQQGGAHRRPHRPRR